MVRRRSACSSRPSIGISQGESVSRSLEAVLPLSRMDNLQMCVEDVIAKKVPGDLIETGVWRGGATIFMRAIVHLLHRR